MMVVSFSKGSQYYWRGWEYIRKEETVDGKLRVVREVKEMSKGLKLPPGVRKRMNK